MFFPSAVVVVVVVVTTAAVVVVVVAVVTAAVVAQKDYVFSVRGDSLLTHWKSLLVVVLSVTCGIPKHALGLN